jgi:hypothetical protein
MPDPSPKRKFRGTIVVEHDEHVALFFLGWKKYRASIDRPFSDRGQDWFVGNVGVAYDEINHLELLGHKVAIIDESDEG